MPHPIAFGIHMDALYTSPPKFPDDNVRLLFSCMVCEALDQTTIRMNYAFGEAEVNCFCCGTQWKMKATLATKQVEVYIKWQGTIRDKKTGGGTMLARGGGLFCENCGCEHDDEPARPRRRRPIWEQARWRN